MTKEQKIIRAKVGLLELAKQLGNARSPAKVTSELEIAAKRFRSAWA